MMETQQIQYDEIGPWSEIKLEILRDYASAYSRILSTRRNPSFKHVYIDAFAGAGVHLSTTSQQFVPGSPLNALLVKPPFTEYHLIDLDGDKTAQLQKLTQINPLVNIHKGDCNEILIQNVFPLVRYEDYKRGLCLLDPYGLQLDWSVIEHAGKLGTIDLFLNFPTMDMNRTVLLKDPSKASQSCIDRMNRFWGDETWREAAYQPLPMFEQFQEKRTNEAVVRAFCKRLKTKAEFKYVPDPIPMKNSRGATLYYLIFASQQPVAKDIINSIFKKYRT